MCAKRKNYTFVNIFTYISIIAGKETHHKLLNTRWENVTPKQIWVL